MNDSLKHCLEVARDAALDAGDDFAVETLTGLLAGSREDVASACGIWREGAIESIGFVGDRELRIVYESPGPPSIVISGAVSLSDRIWDTPEEAQQRATCKSDPNV